MIVSMKIGPDGRIGVQIFPPACIAQHSAMPLDNDHWLAPEPIPHLRERMPNIAVIKLGG
jgi:hypothetical protein